MRANAPPIRRQSLADMLSNMAVLLVDQAVANKFGEIRAVTLDQGRNLPEVDLFIAATALVHGLTMVTHNVQDFAHVPGIQIVDWLAP
jgi:tRNA(fMet)-specific endonuclease VapC